MSAVRLPQRLFFFAALAALWVPLAAHAQVADSVYSIGEITVTAARSEVVRALAPQRITVLDREDITSSASQSVADLLESRSSLFIRRHGEGLATASLRGAGPSQTQILVDGMRLSDPQLGQVDLSLLPTHFFQSAEILHGPGSALYGAEGMSGIIHLRSRGVDADRVSMAMEVGAYGERLASAGVSQRGQHVSGLVSAEIRRTDGDFPFIDHTLFPPREVRRDNADRETRSVFATLSGAVGAHRLKAAALLADSRQGIPGVAGSADQGERRWDEHARLWLEDAFPTAAGEAELRAFVHRGVLRYSNAVLDIDGAGRTFTTGVEGSLRSQFGAPVEATGGISLGYGAADHPSLSTSASELHGAAFGSAVARFGDVWLFPALRLDLYRQSDRTLAAVSPRVGLNAPVLRDLPLHAKLNGATGFRVPTFNDRFWQPGGNPSLMPERSVSIDAGIYLDEEAVRSEVTAFWSRYEDQIVWTNDGSRGYWSPVNLTESRSKGIEISSRMVPASGVTLGTEYVYTIAVDRSDPESRSYGRQLRYVPRHLAKVFVTTRLGAARFDLNGRYIGSRFVSSDESERLDPSFVADVQIALEGSIGPFSGRLAAVVENALDTKYAVIRGYPMPPRHLRIRLLLETP